MLENLFIYGILGLIALIVIFLVCRELVCWYWKLNEIVFFLRKIAGLLEGLQPANANLGSFPESSKQADDVFSTCPKCNRRYAGNHAGQYCGECGTALIV